MKKTMCLLTIVFVAFFFSGCASFLDKILVCEEAAVPVDTDGDGVPDCSDKCPGTLKGVPVNADGCYFLKGLHFDTDKAELKAGLGYFKELDLVADVLIKNPDVKGEVQGHTDNVGNAEYNQNLSERRAASVKEYLVSKGVAAERLTVKGYGLTMPIASNDTKEGRAKNRRVQLKEIK
jgi:OOP family OmpA-OmpF porin